MRCSRWRPQATSRRGAGRWRFVRSVHCSGPRRPNSSRSCPPRMTPASATRNSICPGSRLSRRVGRARPVRPARPRRGGRRSRAQGVRGAHAHGNLHGRRSAQAPVRDGHEPFRRRFVEGANCHDRHAPKWVRALHLSLLQVARDGPSALDRHPGKAGIAPDIWIQQHNDPLHD